MLGVDVGWRLRCCAAGCCWLLLACGSTSGSPPTPDPSGSTAGGGAAGRAGSGSGGSGSGGSGFGGSDSGGLLLGGTAGVVADNDGGELSLGGAADSGVYQGPVGLCLYDAEIPDSWRAAGSTEVGVRTCFVGVLGGFGFDGCRYELLATQPFDVDPFVGNHSHCCYRSKLVGCP